jgi:hypothetical protein
VGYELVQEIQSSIQNKVTVKRGAIVTTGGVTCSNVARNGNSNQEGVHPQRWQQQQTPPVASAPGTGESSQCDPRYSTVTITPMCVIPIIGRVRSHKIIPSRNVRWKWTCDIGIRNSGCIIKNKTGCAIKSDWDSQVTSVLRSFFGTAPTKRSPNLVGSWITTPSS